ncbi:Protein ACTIVITY OF BC1 COMPLEX KINASE 8, chloroplastic [Turnera subulata]|uniref:Protein ACTIVITY OF BC1 COMPLEX KINASE 8, chloroplastic n=1 Tax=Turnera subulata TaxID=218843 RepID=A0A9Q0G575_9ROSI|nr:Protein ACTIVITY OF BC1 COMPLEX KINASE 8, chloroplastic [Turnera subulata]
MASSSSSLVIPDLTCFSPQQTTSTTTLIRQRLSLSRLTTSPSANHCTRLSKFRPRLPLLRASARKEDSAASVIEEERSKLLKQLGPNGNGAAVSTPSGSSDYDFGTNGTVSSSYTNGASGRGNGSLVEYVNGNGNGVAAAAAAVEVVEKGDEAAQVSKAEEAGRKKRIEEIGREDAWFKQAKEQQNVEVSVAPGGRWSRFKTYSTIQRTLEIWGFVFSFIFKAWFNNQKFAYRGGMTEEKKVARRKALAKWLKENILRLGPTFIKIGQQFSTRVDILPQEYVDQLSELQDQVPPFPSETAVSIVEEELGGPLDDVFDWFDHEPIAAASLGQVHRARLKGQEVVIKVQRPGLKDLFDIDLKNLRVISEYLQKVDPKSDGAKRDWVAIYDECASVLYQSNVRVQNKTGMNSSPNVISDDILFIQAPEIDYTKEAANAELFATNFKDMDYVKVPTIYWEYTTPQVLTMEYVPGIKINKIQALDQLGVDRKRLGRYAVESYLEQILSHGFFHADPHPGNIAVDDVNGGRLIFYDFGMMGSISPNIREGLLEAFYGIYEKDPDKVLEAMIQMGVLVPTGDMTAVRRTAQFFLNSFEERLAAQRREREMATTELGFKKPLSKEEKIEKKKQRLAAIGEDLLSIAADQPFRFPATFTFVVRAFSVLDGIGKGLDPRFDITEIAKPYALELLKFREAGVEVILKDFRKRWDRQSRAFYNLFRQADRVEKLAETIQRLEQGDLKLRVRTLEAERAFQRVAAVQKTVGSAVAAGSLVNLATILYLNSIRVPAIAAYVVCAFFSLQALVGIVKVKKFDQRERLITGTA